MPFMLLHRVKKPIMAPNSRKNARQDKSATLELVPKELNHLAAILYVYARGLNFMK